MKILKSILNYIPLTTFIIFVVTDGIFSLTSALIFVISTIGLLINWKRKKTEMKNWENSSFVLFIKYDPSTFLSRKKADGFFLHFLTSKQGVPWLLKRWRPEFTDKHVKWVNWIRKMQHSWSEPCQLFFWI